MRVFQVLASGTLVLSASTGPTLAAPPDEALLAEGVVSATLLRDQDVQQVGYSTGAGQRDGAGCGHARPPWPAGNVALRAPYADGVRSDRDRTTGSLEVRLASAAPCAAGNVAWLVGVYGLRVTEDGRDTSVGVHSSFR